MATIKSFKDLEVWKLANDLQIKIFALCNTQPLSKDYSLKDQMNRSSGSIMDNIAEGFGRGGRIEFIQFLAIAKGSACELQSQLFRCMERKYLTKQLYDELNELAEKIGNKIGAFIKYLNASDLSGPKFQNRVSNAGRINDKQETKNEKTRNEKHQTINSKPQTSNNITITTLAAKPLGTYPHARRIGNLLFLSGIGSRNPVDDTIPGLVLDEENNIKSYDIEAECKQVFANVKAVLEASGSSWDMIVDVTVFLTSMKKDFAAYNKIYGEYFNEVQACRTTVEVKSLPTPIAIELKVIAVIE